MIDIAGGKRRVGGQKIDRLFQEGFEFFAEDAGFFAAIITLEAARVSNCPHSGSR